MSCILVMLYNSHIQLLYTHEQFTLYSGLYHDAELYSIFV